MGNIAEMMIDGTLCNECGVYLGGQAHGVPRFCSDCKPSQGKIAPPRKKGETRKVKCPHCERICKKGQSLTDHMRDVHGITKGSTNDLKAENKRLREMLETLQNKRAKFQPSAIENLTAEQRLELEVQAMKAFIKNHLEEK